MKKNPYDISDVVVEDQKETKRLMIKVALLLISIVVVICLFIANFVFGSNWMSRKYGGEITVNLEENRKLMNVTWKNDSLWILTREMRDDEEAESYIYKEDSNLGILEGSIHIIETKRK